MCFLVKFSCFYVLIIFVNYGIQVSGVKINKLQVPEVIKHGAAVVLDCDFTLEETDDDLVVKWFFTNQSLVYQWIAASKSKPQVLGVLRDRLNLSHHSNADSVHRTLHILNAGPDMSGDYTCSVSTMQSEDIRTKSMLVFVPEKSLVLRRLSDDKGYMRVQCTAEGVFPRPVMTLSSQDREIVEAEVTSRQRGHLYEISATATLEALKAPEVFSCELKIPQANYTVRRETVIYPGENKGLLITNDRWITISTCILSLYTSLSRLFIGTN